MKSFSFGMLIFWLSTTLVQASPPNGLEAFHEQVVKTYSFSPHKLSKEEILAKSDILDQFWNTFQENKDRNLPLLREELKRPDNPSFFYFDGSMLLLSLSEDSIDRQLALEVIPRVNLLDVRELEYFKKIHWFARLGYDTTEAALKILEYPEFKVFVVQHVLTLGQNYSLIYMLYPTKEEYYLDPLIERLKTEKTRNLKKVFSLQFGIPLPRKGR